MNKFPVRDKKNASCKIPLFFQIKILKKNIHIIKNKHAEAQLGTYVRNIKIISWPRKSRDTLTVPFKL